MANKTPRQALDDVLEHEGFSLASLAENMGMSEQKIISGVVGGDQSIIGRISSTLDNKYVVGYLLNPTGWSYNQDGELGPATEY